MYTLYIDKGNEYTIFNHITHKRSHWGALEKTLNTLDQQLIKNTDSSVYIKYNLQPIATFETKKDLDNIQKTHPELFI